MRTIWKFSIALHNEQFVQMPKGAVVLSAQVQNGILCLWADIETHNDNETRHIYINGTGNPIQQPADARYVSTVIMDAFVWHVYVQ